MSVKYNLFLTSCNLCRSHGQLHELVFLLLHQGSHFWKCHNRLFIVPHRQSDLSYSVFSLMTIVLVQSLSKMLHNKFRMIIFHDQKAISLSFKSSYLRMFFKIDVLKNLAMFTGKHLCWSYFLI